MAVILACERALAASATVEPELAAALVAVAAIGIAVHTGLTPSIEHAHEAAAGAILLLAVASALPVGVIADPVRMAWLHHPWVVTAAAAVVTAGATRHRAA
jgi:hypothetical protein